MKQENKCESPMGGWFAMCDIYNNDGTYRGMGTGKAISEVTYYNVNDETKTEYTYKMCKDCVECEKIGHDIGDEHQITEIKYFDGRKSEYPNAKLILSDLK